MLAPEPHFFGKPRWLVDGASALAQDESCDLDEVTSAVPARVGRDDIEEFRGDGCNGSTSQVDTIGCPRISWVELNNRTGKVQDMSKAKSLGMLAGFLLPLGAVGDVLAHGEEGASEPRLVYEIKASKPRLNRRVTGDVVASVDGVVAEPVDSFVWDGSGSVPVEGKAKLKIDPVANTGKIWVEWEDRNGSWTYEQSFFAPPSHPTGLRLGASAGATEFELTDPVTTNVYLHGDTGAAGPVLPTVFNLLATWGPATVTRNGEVFANPFDGPVPQWAGHTMTTLGVRGSDGSVRTTSGEIFSFARASEGAVDQNDLEFHLVFHDVPGPQATGNLPPPLSFFYHLTFEKVSVKIHQE